jgi:hypothetical protein
MWEENMTPYVKTGSRWELIEDIFSAFDTLKKGTIVECQSHSMTIDINGVSFPTRNIIHNNVIIRGVSEHRMRLVTQ